MVFGYEKELEIFSGLAEVCFSPKGVLMPPFLAGLKRTCGSAWLCWKERPSGEFFWLIQMHKNCFFF